MIKVNDYFDKIYCMNLDHRIDRWEESIEEFKKHKIIVDRFPAFYGKNIYRGQKPIRSTEFGCLFTHLAILIDARKNNYSSVLIFEDDVELHNNFNDLFDNFIKKVPANWDMLYLGANRATSIEVPLNESVSAASSLLGGHAYAVKNTIYDKLISALEATKSTVDETYANNQVLFNTYLARPLMAWQRAGYSDINHIHVSYEFLKEGLK